MKKLENLLKDYTLKLSTDNLKFLSERLNERFSGDLAEVLDFFARDQEIDKWLASAKSGKELFTMVDSIHDYIDKELIKRFPELLVS